MKTIYQTYNANKGKECFSWNGEEYFYTLSDGTIIIYGLMTSLSDYPGDLISFVFRKFNCKKIIVKQIIKGNCVYNLNNFFLKISSPHNFCLTLPSSIDIYLSSLGKKTRQHLKWYQRQLDKYLKEKYKNEVGGGYITEDKNVFWEHFNAIVDLNKERCRGKGFESGVKAKELFDMINGCCVLNYFMIDNKIVAGTISSVYNGAMNLHVIAHSNEYSNFNLGNLILLKTIEYSISNNIGIFNFLWGECEYKKRFGATEQLFYDVCFYTNNLLYVIEKGFYNVQCTSVWLAKEIKKYIQFLLKIMKCFLKKICLFDVSKRAYYKIIGK